MTNLVHEGHCPIGPWIKSLGQKEITRVRKRERDRVTAITSQEDQDGESQVFTVQAIYLTMTNTIVESEITDSPNAAYYESESSQR